MDWYGIFYAIFVGKYIKSETNRYRTCTGTGTLLFAPVKFKKIFFSAKAFSKARIRIQTRRIGGYE